MMFGWLRSRRRKAALGRTFPSAWREVLRRDVLQTTWLGEDELSRLQGWVAVFLEEKRFEGCGGFEITDQVRVAIAAQAGLVVLGIGQFWFDSLKSVLVYPDHYLGPRAAPLEGGGQLEWQEARIGEAWDGGSMVLAWTGVRAGGRLRDGPRSVVIHECAHLIDMLTGEINGVPPLPKASVSRWREAMAGCRARFDERLDEGRGVAFDEYAADSPVEFFAVASECFFQDPHRLRRHDAILYGLLAEAYRQDPAGRVPVRH